MASVFKEYRVLVASPSDVAAERESVELVVSQLNTILSNRSSARLRVISWESDSHPAFGSDPQAVLNEQFGTDFEIIIGIFWSSIGTPTPRAASGSLEEVSAALHRFRKERRPRILLYFKTAAIEPSKIDPNQLSALQDFKSSIGPKGGLYHEFNDRRMFESSLRAHLAAVFHELLEEENGADAQLLGEVGPTQCDTDAWNPEADDYGYLDYIEIADRRFSDMGTATSAISEATKGIGNDLRARSQELTGVVGVPPAQARRLLMRTAEDVSRYADVVGAQLPILHDSRVIGFDALSKAFALRTDFPGAEEDLEARRQQLIDLHESIASAKNGMSGMRDSAGKFPRISSEINKAKRVVVERLDGLLTELDATQTAIKNIIRPD